MREIWSSIEAVMQSWKETKLFVEHALSLENSTLHVVIGTLVWLGIAFVARRPISSWMPWLGLVTLTVWNEAVDLWVEQWPHPGMQYGEGARDILITLLVPGVLTLAVRMRPEIFQISQDPSNPAI